MRTIGLASMLLIVAVAILDTSTGGAGPAEDSLIDWAKVTFAEPTNYEADGSLFLVQMWAYQLSVSDPEYEKQRQAGDTWGCIVDLLALAAQTGGPYEGMRGPEGQSLEQITSHCGLYWTMWHRLAVVGQAVNQTGLQSVLNPEVLRVLREMETNLKPYLARDFDEYPVNPLREAALRSGDLYRIPPLESLSTRVRFDSTKARHGRRR